MKTSDSSPALDGMQHKVNILVEKRTYKPAGWKRLRDVIMPCRITPKRIYVEYGPQRLVFDRRTGAEIQPVECRINASIRYTATSTASFG